MVGLVIDGGYAWGRQRATQNGADSIAKAGAVVILEWLDEKPQTIGDVGCAVELAETENNVDLERAEFTDHTGALIGVDVPLCGTAGAIPPTAQGIRAEAAQTFDTFLMSVVGFNELTATGECDRHRRSDHRVRRGPAGHVPADHGALRRLGRRPYDPRLGRARLRRHRRERWRVDAVRDPAAGRHAELRRTSRSSRSARPRRVRSAGWTSAAGTSPTRSWIRATSSSRSRAGSRPTPVTSTAARTSWPRTTATSRACTRRTASTPTATTTSR